MSEKLAAIGEITAGVAHEINNPIAVMQGNLDVIRSVIGDEADKAKVEFRLLDQQIPPHQPDRDQALTVSHGRKSMPAMSSVTCPEASWPTACRWCSIS
jgi:signal transduction histidine kinase